MSNNNQEKITTRAAYEAACVQFVDSLLNSGSPHYFIDALTDTVLVYAQTADVQTRVIDADHLVIMTFRELYPLNDFYQKH